MSTLPPAGGSEMSGEPTTEDLRLELARTQEQLRGTQRERDALAERLRLLEGRYDELQSALTTQQEELGRLRQVATTCDELKQERDALRTELDQTRSAIPDQVHEQLRNRLGEVTKAHDDEVRALQAERERLQTRVTELEQDLGASQLPAMTTSDLAGHFADVLNDLGNPPPAAGEPFAAALTGFNVQAKGLLRTNEQGEVEIVTAQAGAVPAEQLSTVQMELKLLPRLPSPPPEPPTPSAKEPQ